MTTMMIITMIITTMVITNDDDDDNDDDSQHTEPIESSFSSPFHDKIQYGSAMINDDNDNANDSVKYQ